MTHILRKVNINIRINAEIRVAILHMEWFCWPSVP